MGPRRRAVRAAAPPGRAKKIGRGPMGRPAKDSGSGLPEIRGPERGVSGWGNEDFVIGRDGKPQMWRIYAHFGENRGRRAAAGRPAMIPAVHKATEVGWDNKRRTAAGPAGKPRPPLGGAATTMACARTH